MAETFGTGTPKDEDVVVLYKGESKQVTGVLPQQKIPGNQEVTKRCRLSWLTNSAQMRGGRRRGGGRGVSANGYSCAHRV
jgi:hypothetical protein